jgi:hypothetical protein
MMLGNFTHEAKFVLVYLHAMQQPQYSVSFEEFTKETDARMSHSSVKQAKLYLLQWWLPFPPCDRMLLTYGTSSISLLRREKWSTCTLSLSIRVRMTWPSAFLTVACALNFSTLPPRSSICDLDIKCATIVGTQSASLMTTSP